MSFVATNAPNENAPSGTVENNGFWPAIAIDDFRDDERLGRDITDRRVRQALIAAMGDINRQLAAFQQTQADNGAAGVHEIPGEAWQTPGHYAQLYVRAVYAMAQADLLERYRDYATAPTGEHRGEVRDAAADDYRRASRWAVAEILGTTHTTVELI